MVVGLRDTNKGINMVPYVDRNIKSVSNDSKFELEDRLVEECSGNGDFGELAILAKEKGYASDMKHSMKPKNDQRGTSVCKVTQALSHLSKTLLWVTKLWFGIFGDLEDPEDY